MEVNGIPILGTGIPILGTAQEAAKPAPLSVDELREKWEKEEADWTDDYPPSQTYDEQVKANAKAQADQARAMASLDTSSMPTWFSTQLDGILGPIPPMGINIVAARPGCGKTSFMLTQARHMVAGGHKIIYVGTETPGWRLRMQLAAQAVGLPVKLVVQGRWGEMPPGSHKRFLEALDAFDEHSGGRWHIAPEDVVDHNLLMEYVHEAAGFGGSLFVDHLHEVKWGAGSGGLTQAMSDGVQALKNLAKEKNVRLFLAAQIGRPSDKNQFANYLVPELSSIKQCGTIEEIGHIVLLLHKALKPGATEVELALVRRGQKSLGDIIEHGTSVVTVGKDRLGGSADEEARLYIENSELFDSQAARALRYPLPWVQK